MIDLSQAQERYATYLPAVTRKYIEDVIRPLKRPISVTETDLNFLDPKTTLFYLPNVLYSAGQADLASEVENAVSKRNRRNTFVLGDSGGFQIISDKLNINGKSGPELNDTERKVILDWLERHCDWAMTIDVPTGALEEPLSGYTGFTETVGDTFEHLKYFWHGRSGTTKFLNCLHGRNIAECDIFYEAVRYYRFEGWAFASGYKDSIYLVLHRLLTMRDLGDLDGKKRLHFLGRGALERAVILTAIQRALQNTGFPDIKLTFDASTPFTSAARGDVYTGYRITPDRGFTIDQAKAPDAEAYIGSDIPFPWRSPLGDRIVMGDLCPNQPKVTEIEGSETGKRRTTWDFLSYMLLMNHNLFVQIEALVAANRVFELETADARNFVPPRLLEMRERISEAFVREDWQSFIDEHEGLLSKNAKELVDHSLGAYDDYLPLHQRPQADKEGLAAEALVPAEAEAPD